MPFSLAQYTEFLETLPDPVLLLDARGAVLFANMQVSSILDVPPDELLHRPAHMLLAPRHRPRQAGPGQPTSDLFTRPEPRMTIWLLRRDGREVPVDLATRLHAVEDRTVTLCVLRDMSARQSSDTLAKLGSVLRAASTRSDAVHILLRELLTLLDANGTALVVKSGEGDDVVIEAAHGVLAEWTARELPSDTVVSAGVLESGTPYVANAVEADPLLSEQDLPAAVRALASVPVRADTQVVAALVVGKATAFTDDDIQLLLAIGEMVAITLQRLALTAQLVQDAATLEEAYEDMLAAWARALDRRERIADGHTERVTALTLRLAKTLDVGPEELPHVRRGALLHDIGKIVVPDHILRKPGRLDESEQAIMRKHTEYTYDLLGPIEFLRPALQIPYFHHERWDGAGYPRGLKETDIPLAARIFAVADVYDAIMSDRSYQSAQTHRDALGYIVEQSGKHFDPRVVDALLTVLTDESADGRRPARAPQSDEPRQAETRSSVGSAAERRNL
jgi:PAS domain S-box-containing protein